MTSLFLCYARGNDGEPFDPAASFVGRLHRDLTARGFEVWFDRMAMPARGLTFHQETQDAVAARERLVLVVGPKATMSDYVRQEWLFVLHADKAVTPILRQGDYLLEPDELRVIKPQRLRRRTPARLQFA
jgi:TIR domain